MGSSKNIGLMCSHGPSHLDCAGDIQLIMPVDIDINVRTKRFTRQVVTLGHLGDLSWTKGGHILPGNDAQRVVQVYLERPVPGRLFY